jgi:hypothetical protein
MTCALTKTDKKYYWHVKTVNFDKLMFQNKVNVISHKHINTNLLKEVIQLK